MISFTSAWNTSTFNNSLSTENITFSGDENYIRWLQVPEDIIVTSATMNLSGYYSYNESIYTEVDIEDSAAWSQIPGSPCAGTLNNGGNAYDENFTTYSTHTYQNTQVCGQQLIENITGIANMGMIKLNTTYAITTATHSATLGTISYDCSADGISYISIGLSDSATAGDDITETNILINLPENCWNETVYLKTKTTVRGYPGYGGDSHLYENKLIFYNESYTTNPYIKINNTQVWNHTGEFNSTFSPNKTSNFAATINNYISTASAVAGYYLIPFIFHSDTIGILEYLALIFNNDGFYENSQTYENSTFSGGVETFQLNITYDNNRYSNSQAYFYYNGDSYLATKTGSGSALSFSKTLNMPILTTETNKTFYWQVELYDETWEYYNSTFHNQTIFPVYLGICGGVSNDTLINMSLLDENTQTNITGDIQINVDIISKSSGEIVESLNTSFEDVQYGVICLSPVSSYNLYYLDMEIRYTSNGYVPELYHIQRAELSNTTTTLNLYDLNESHSTEFKVTYQDNTFNFIEGAIIQLQRKYISEGVYKTVEAPLTSNEGVAILHIDLDSIKYRATVVKDGVVLDEFDNLVFKCQSELTGECEQKLLGEIDPSNDINIDTTRDFSYSLSRVDNVITLSFSIPSGLPSSVNMQMTQKDQFGNDEMCNTTIVSSAGSIQCTYNDTIGDSYIDLRIYKNTESMAVTSYIIPESGDMGFLGNNYIIIIVLLLSIVGMALTSPEWIIINGIIVMVISGALWLINGLDFVVGLGNLMWLVIAAGILIFKLAKQEDR